MFRRAKTVRLVAVLCAVSLLAAACSSSTSTSKPSSSSKSSATKSTTPIPISIQLYSGSFYTYLADIAQVQGFFTKNGLDATMINVTAGGSVAMAAVASGSADMAMGDLPLTGPYLERGVGMTAVSGAVSAAWEIVAAKGETFPASYPASVHALAGKSVGVVGLGTSSYDYLKALLSTAGMSPTSVNYAALGGLPANAVAALGADRVAAAFVTPDLAYYLINDLHYQLVYNFNSVADAEAAGGIWKTLAGKSDGFMWATNSWIAAHPGGVSRFQLAMEEADVWMHNPANLTKVLADLEAQKNVPSFAAGPAGPAYFKSILPYVVAYVPAGSATAFRSFWIKAGALNANFPPPSKWFASGIPTSSAQVVANVKAAGEGKLGNTAS